MPDNQSNIIPTIHLVINYMHLPIVIIHLVIIILIIIIIAIVILGSIKLSRIKKTRLRNGTQKKGKSMFFYQTHKLIFLMVHIALQFVWLNTKNIIQCDPPIIQCQGSNKHSRDKKMMASSSPNNQWEKVTSMRIWEKCHTYTQNNLKQLNRRGFYLCE